MSFHLLSLCQVVFDSSYLTATKYAAYDADFLWKTELQAAMLRHLKTNYLHSDHQLSLRIMLQNGSLRIDVDTRKYSVNDFLDIVCSVCQIYRVNFKKKKMWLIWPHTHMDIRTHTYACTNIFNYMNVKTLVDIYDIGISLLPILCIANLDVRGSELGVAILLNKHRSITSTPLFT